MRRRSPSTLATLAAVTTAREGALTLGTLPIQTTVTGTYPDRTRMALRLATDADAAPDPRWLADVDELSAALKARGVGFYCVLECDSHREVLMSGAIDPDGIAGFTARVLAALADNA